LVKAEWSFVNNMSNDRRKKNLWMSFGGHVISWFEKVRLFPRFDLEMFLSSLLLVSIRKRKTSNWDLGSPFYAPSGHYYRPSLFTLLETKTSFELTRVDTFSKYGKYIYIYIYLWTLLENYTLGARSFDLSLAQLPSARKTFARRETTEPKYRSHHGPRCMKGAQARKSSGSLSLNFATALCKAKATTRCPVTFLSYSLNREP